MNELEAGGEPSAVVPLARICARGGPSPREAPFLPQSISDAGGGRRATLSSNPPRRAIVQHDKTAGFRRKSRVRRVRRFSLYSVG
jgi:hypothetical protein